MNIRELESINLVPFFMQSDASVKGLCKAMDYIFNTLGECLRRSSIYTNLEFMKERDLDYIADADRIFWYNSQDNYETKLKILQNRKKMLYLLGTAYAIEQGLKDITTEESYIEEWMQYGGNPFHYRIILGDDYTAIDKDFFSKLYSRIKKMGNARSVLDGAYMSGIGNVKANAALAAEVMINIALGGDMNGIGNVKANAALAAEARIDIVLGRGE